MICEPHKQPHSASDCVDTDTQRTPESRHCCCQPNPQVERLHPHLVRRWSPALCVPPNGTRRGWPPARSTRACGRQDPLSTTRRTPLRVSCPAPRRLARLALTGRAVPRCSLRRGSPDNDPGADNVGCPSAVHKSLCQRRCGHVQGWRPL